MEMKIYKKILVAKKSDQNQCFAEDGDILVFASGRDKIKGRLRKNGHFFVAINNDRKPSLYGWVAELDDGISLEEFIRMDFASQGNSNADEEQILENKELYERFLEKIQKFKIDTPMAVYWAESLDMDTYVKEKRLWFHRIKFYKS